MSQPLHKQFLIGDEKIRLFARRFIAAQIGRKPNTLAIWQVRGIIPKPIFSINEKAAWYTPDEVLIYVRAAASDDLRSGISMKAGTFMEVVHGEVAALRKRVKTEGPAILEKAENLEDFIRKVKLTWTTCNWRRG